MLLCDGTSITTLPCFRFVSTEEKKGQGVKRDNEVLIQRRKTGANTVPYRIIDNALKLTQDDW